jgi:ABC-type transport system involved in cytochrome c biogenesis permease subunit
MKVKKPEERKVSNETAIQAAADVKDVPAPEVNGHTSPEPDVRLRHAGSPLHQALTALASLRLTVWLFAFSLLLVFFGTLAQIDLGIWTIVKQYFRSALVWVPFKIFFVRSLNVPGSFPFPGGWLLGGLLLANLLAAHAVRFKLSWKRSGILLLHAGLIVMMLSELVTGLFAIEGNMSIETGRSSNYLEHMGAVELAVIDPSDPKVDDVVVVPAGLLKKGGLFQHDQLPFDVEVQQYMVNSALIDPPAASANRATKGYGVSIAGVVERPEVSGTDPDQKVDVPAAYVTLRKKGTGEALGSYLLSPQWSRITATFAKPEQDVTVDGKTYTVNLRFKRQYKPYTIALQDFRHDVYPGTDKPKDFSAFVHLTNPSTGDDLDAHIWMNHPLRYEGETFYQSQTLGDDSGTVLQVVRNPGWLMPYISCGMVAIGMLIHFGIKLVNFLDRSRVGVPQAVPSSKPGAETVGWMPIVAGTVVAGLVVLMVALMTIEGSSEMRLAEFAQLPVQDGGRIKPFDTLARNNLMVISNKQTFKEAPQQGKAETSQPATKWLLDVMTANEIFKNPAAAEHRVFRIESDQLLSVLSLQPRSGLTYSISEFDDEKKLAQLARSAEKASKIDPDRRTEFDGKVLEFFKHLKLYRQLADPDNIQMVPPADGGAEWRSLVQAFRDMHQNGGNDKPAVLVLTMVVSYGKGDVQKFNDALTEYQKWLHTNMPAVAETASFETGFNHLAPFLGCMVLYALVFMMGCASFLLMCTQSGGWAEPLRRAAFWMTVVALVLHTYGILARMYIQGRPPVTNLYSSAVFIGWGCVALGLFLEVLFKRGIGIVVAAVLGFATSIIAHNLAAGGDTLEMMQAVLDTNFWLATHVTCVTFGYTATFFAGFLAIAYLGLGLLTPWLTRDLLKTLSSMTYGVVCFAMFLSFTGTVLGGIWADQSWGRFWGWDPKENGALLIVLWNALILHARWSGMVKQRGMAVLAVLGNVVTAWSWFGVNMLGVGLHSYGKMDRAVLWLWIFVGSQLLIAGAGMLPMRKWRSAPV